MKSEDFSWVYQSPRWKQARDHALARDGICQSRHANHRGKLSVHHIVPLRHGGQPFHEHNLVTHHERADRLIPEHVFRIPDCDELRYRKAAATEGLSFEDWLVATLDAQCERLAIPETPHRKQVTEDDKQWWLWMYDDPRV